MIFRNLHDPHLSGMKLMIDASAVAKGNVLIPFTSNKLFSAFEGIGVNKAPNVMLVIKKIGDLEFLHLDTLLSSMRIVPATLKIHSTYSPAIPNSVTWTETGPARSTS